MEMNWNYCSNAFHKDGSLRDLYIHDTNIEDWVSLLSFLVSSPYELEYTRDGILEPVPTDVASIFTDLEHAHNLIIRLGIVGICCHFFITEEIEMDIDPREVTSQHELDAIMKFMFDVGVALGRDFILTEENGPEHVWFRYSVDSQQIDYIGGS